MDLYIDRETLSRTLARVQGIIERRSTYPILSHVLLHAHPEGLRLTATDSEIAFIGDLQANVSTPGDLAVDAADLFQVIRALPEPTVRIAQGKGNRLEVASGRATFRLPFAPAEQYPAVPAFDGEGVVTIREGDLRRMVEQTAFSVATDDVRYGLNGARLEERRQGDELRLRIVGTDGHRLAASEGVIQGTPVIHPRMLVPRKALGVMRKLIEGDDEDLQLTFGDGAIRLERPGQTFWFRMLDGEFPNYEAVVPGEGSHKVMASREVLASALKRVGILVQDRAKAVRFAFGDNELTIQVSDPDRGEVSETVPVELDGEPITVGFNVRYLQDVLGAIGGSTVRIDLGGPLSPGLVRDPERDDAFFVIMPMRLD